MKTKGLEFIGLNSGFWYQYSLIIAPEAYGFDIKNKTVTFINDGARKISTSTWPQSGRAVAAALSLPIYPESPGDEGKGPFLSDWADRSLLCYSFQISQQDMLASLLRVTGEKESDWTIQYEPAEERWQRGMSMLKEGNRAGFAIALYTPTFMAYEAGDHSSKADNNALRLPKEDLDDVRVVVSSS